METILQLLFWVLAGLWWIGLRFPYMELIIGICALIMGILLIL